MLAAINAQREADRAAVLAERRAAWHAASLHWQGDCATCLDTGRDFMTDLDCACSAGEHRGAERERRRLEARQEVIAVQAREVMRSACIPPEYADWTLENFPRRVRTLISLRGWAANWDGREGLMLFGPYGVGKTSLMIGLMRLLVTNYLSLREDGVIRARFKRASELFTQLRAAMDEEDGAYDRLMTEAKRVRIFVLDDLGRENPKSDWVSETLFEIVDGRYAHGLPIFATTNYTPETLSSRLGGNADAIMERINDRCAWMRVTGASMRKTHARVIE